MQAELQAMCALSVAESFEGNVREGVKQAREAHAHGRKFSGLAPARELYLGLALANADEIDEAMLWIQAGHDIAARVADLWLISRHQTARTAIGWISGDWEGVVADAEAVVALRADTGILNGLPQVAALAAMVALQRGDDAALVRWIAVSRESAGPGAEMAGMLYHGWMEALVAEHDGRIGDGAALLAYVYETAGEAAPLVQLWLAGDLVRMTLVAHDVARAESVIGAMALVAEKVGTASARATLSFCRGQLAQHAGITDRAVAEYRSAFVAAGSVRRLPLQRAAAVALVGCLREAGLRAEAESVAGMADELTGALGIASSALSMPDSSATESVKTDAAAPAGPAKRRMVNLTPTEERIATLVAEGLSNSQIALAAKMTKRTVEFYLSSLYVKLGLSNRVELAAHVTEKMTSS